MAHHLIYGGTFDPIHHGHLIACRRARELVQADKVVLVPARVSPHKSSVSGGALPEQRLMMIRLAIENEPDFQVDGRELKREGPSFTVDTIREMAAEESAAEAHRMTLLIGADQLAKLHTWHRIAELLAMVEVAVLGRPGVDVAGWLRSAREVLGEAATGRLKGLETPLIEISATDIRQRVAAGLPVSYLVPGPVARYIASERLYRG